MMDQPGFPPPFTSLKHDVDYLYCPVCKTHIACIRTDVGWEVCCPGCIGECAMCKCYLSRFCFGRREEFPPFPTKDSEE